MSVAYILVIPFITLYTKGVSDINYVYEYVPLLFCLIQLLSFGSYVTKNLTNIAGYAKVSGQISVIEAVINVSVSLLLVKRFGIYGVLIATTVALPLKMIYCAYLSDKNILKRSCKRTIRILGSNFLLFFLIVIVEKNILLNIHNYWEFIIAGVITTAVCTVLGVTVNIFANPDCIEIVKTIYLRKLRR